MPKPYLLFRQTTVKAPLSEVFDYFATPENLQEITPGDMSFEVLTPSPLLMGQGAVYDYVLRIFGLPVRWTTMIVEYEPRKRFVDVQLKGPYSFWHHTHTFEEVEGGTRITDEVRYLLPFGILGEIAHEFLVRRQLKQIFDFRYRAMLKRFGKA